MSYSQNHDDVKDTIAYRHGAQPKEELAQKNRNLNRNINNSSDPTLDHTLESSSNLHSELDELTKEATEKFEHYKKTGKLLSHHASGIVKLAKTEAQLTASAYSKIIKLVAILAPIALILYISICVCIGLVSYSLTQSILVSSGIFLAFQVCIVAGIILSVQSAKSHIGFNKTKQHIKGLKNELAHLF